MDIAIFGWGFPAAAQGVLGGTDGTSWFFSSTTDIELSGPSTVFARSAINSFLAFEGYPIVRSGFLSYTKAGSGLVTLPTVNFAEFPSFSADNVTQITFSSGVVIVLEPSSQTANVMASVSFEVFTI
jgi:hypothetical protein